MKRTGLTIIALVLALTGCANVEADKETTAAPTEATVSPDTLQTPSAEPGNGAIDYISAITKIDTAQISAPNGGEGAPMPLDYEALTAPPALTVSTLEYVDSVIASCGNYHWSHTLPDGTATEVLACGAHPLDQQEHPIIYTAFPAGALSFSEDGGAVGSLVPVFYLDFGGISPETVSVIRWPASYIGDAQGHSTDFETVTTEFDGDTILLLPPGDGNYVYEVSAEWGNAGGASYTFRTLPQYGERRRTCQQEYLTR